MKITTLIIKRKTFWQKVFKSDLILCWFSVPLSCMSGYFGLVDGISGISFYGRLLRQHRLRSLDGGRGWPFVPPCPRPPQSSWVGWELPAQPIAEGLMPLMSASRCWSCREDCGPRHPVTQCLLEHWIVGPPYFGLQAVDRVNVWTPGPSLLTKIYSWQP